MIITDSQYRPPLGPEHRMILVVLALFMLWTSTLTHAAEGIRQVPLNPERVTPVAVAANEGTTTLLFPSAVEAIRAGKVATEAKPGVDFLLTYKAGQHYLTLRALRPRATDALTVIYQREAYVFELTASETPDFTVTLTDEHATSGSRTPVSPARLAGVLDKAKAYHALLRDAPQAVEGVDYVVFGEEFSGEGFTLRLNEVWRFHAQDTLVFHITLTNPGDAPVRYSPQEFSIRAGDQLLSPSLVDASGTIPGNGQETVFFAVTGSPDGGRANLSVTNDWRVILPRLPDDPVSGDAATASAQPELPTK